MKASGLQLNRRHFIWLSTVAGAVVWSAPALSRGQNINRLELKETI